MEKCDEQLDFNLDKQKAQDNQFDARLNDRAAMGSLLREAPELNSPEYEAEIQKAMEEKRAACIKQVNMALASNIISLMLQQNMPLTDNEFAANIHRSCVKMLESMQ